MLALLLMVAEAKDSLMAKKMFLATPRYGSVLLMESIMSPSHSGP